MIATITGCGSSSPVVVKIGDGKSITKATMDHWTKIEALVTHELPLRKQPPKGVIPDAPSYTNCIAYLRKLTAGGPKGTSSTAQLKSECRHEHTTLQNQMLEILITSDWLAHQAAGIGVKVSAAEVKQALRKKLTAAQLQQYLKFGGLTEAEEVFLLKRTLTGNAVRKAIESSQPTPARRQQALISFYTALQQKWTPQTSCRPGYIVVQCRDYRAGTT